MDSAAKALLIMFVAAVCLGIAIVLLNPHYRPAKIAETNKGVFANIPYDAAESAEEPPPKRHGETARE